MKRWKKGETNERNNWDGDLYGDVYSAGRSLLEKEKDSTELVKPFF